MKPRHAASLCIAGASLGAAVFVSGLLWTTFGGARLVYSEQDAKEYQQAATALHTATYGHVHVHAQGDGREHAAPAPADDEADALAKAQERFARAKQSLDSARFAEDRLGGWIMAAGLAMVSGFGVGYWSLRG